MLQYKYTFSLRLSHSTRDLEKAYSELGFIPGIFRKRIWKVGEPRKTIKNEPLEGVYKYSYCYFEFFEKTISSDTETLPSAIRRVVESLSEKKELLNEHIANGGRLEFFIGWYFDRNSGDVFDLELLKKITDLGIELSFDIYPEG